MTSMKRLGRFLMAALKVTLGFFAWLFRAVFKWVMQEEAGNLPASLSFDDYFFAIFAAMPTTVAPTVRTVPPAAAPTFFIPSTLSARFASQRAQSFFEGSSRNV